MTTLDVHLFDTNPYKESSVPINGSIGLLWFQEKLLDIGIDSTIYPVTDRPISPGNVITRLIQTDPEEPEESLRVMGFSCFHHTIKYAVSLSKIIQESMKKTIVIGGGPMFREHSTSIGLIEQGYFHAINRGNCMPAVQLLEDLKSGKHEITDWEKPFDNFKVPDGIYTFNKGKPIGRKTRRKITFKDRVPLNMEFLNGEDVKKLKIELPVGSSCANGCDYCTSENNQPLPQELLVNSVVSQAKKYEGMDLVISLSGNNPLSPRNIKASFKLLEEIAKTNPYTSAASYIDPSDLEDHKYLEKIVRAITDYRINTLCIGFDATDEKSARIIGRNFLRQPRSQERLEREVKNVSTLISKAKKGLGKHELNVALHYIATPFDTNESIQKALSNLYTIGSPNIDETIKLRFVFFPLWLLNGSKIRNRLNPYLQNRDSEEHLLEYKCNWEEMAQLSPEAMGALRSPGELRLIKGVLSDSEHYFMQLATIAYGVERAEAIKSGKTPDSNIGNQYIPEVQTRDFRSDLLKERYAEFVEMLPRAIQLLDKEKPDWSPSKVFSCAYYQCTLKERII